MNTGVFFDYKTRDLDRISTKSVELTCKCLQDPAFREECLASEDAMAIHVALRNLSTNAGFSDSMRLTLRMESKLAEDSRELFEDKQIGGAMLNVLPVHSQHRGRIFLPFVDDEPRTTEIISKVILFSEDRKLKDPTILSQIKS